MNTTLGIVGGLVVGAALGFGVTTAYKSSVSSSQAGAKSADAYVLELDGTKYKESDLPASVRAQIFETQEQAHQRVDGLLSQFALQMGLAKDKNKDVKADNLPPLDQLVDTPQPTEQEMKQLYDANKSRLPPNTTYDKVKDDIAKFVKNQRLSEALRTKDAEFKAKNRVKLLTTAPVAPAVDLQLTAYAAKGPQAASNTLVEVADYLCPHCQAAQPEIQAALKDVGDKVRFVAVPFSLRPESLSGTLARGAYCAKQQGDDAFWKYHETAFKLGKDKGWHSNDPDDKGPVLEVVKEAGLDAAKMETCIATPAAQEFVKNTDEAMQKAGVSGTPTFFMNNHKLSLDHQSLKDAIMAGMKGGAAH